MLAVLAAFPAFAQTNAKARDFTIFLLSDIHLGAENLQANPPVTREQTLAKVRANLEAMRGLVGQPYPDRAAFAGLKLGAVAAPRGLFILGDLTDGHREPALAQEQWQTFDALFPAPGVAFDGKKAPVFALAGNHDGAVAGPQRQGLVGRNRALEQTGQLAARSPNGVHYALNWDGVHFIFLNLCPADAPDTATPFKFGTQGPGSWNDPQGALSFLADYLARHVGASGAPVVLLQHYGFDTFSLNDWNWWTLKQRRALYDLRKHYNVAAFFHGHNHRAEHYRWPDPQSPAADLAYFFDGKPSPNPRQYDVLSCGLACWVIRIRGDQLIAAHFNGRGWAAAPANFFVKSLNNVKANAQ